MAFNPLELNLIFGINSCDVGHEDIANKLKKGFPTINHKCMKPGREQSFYEGSNLLSRMGQSYRK